MFTKRMTRGFGVLESFLARRRARLANKLIPNSMRNGRILDIGCGARPFFLLNTEFREKYGVDPAVQTPGCEEGLTLAQCDVTRVDRLPFADDFFDVITMLAVVEHIDPARLVHVFGEVRRLLRPNGRFILTTPHRCTAGLLRFMSKLRLVSADEIRDHKAAYDVSALVQCLEQAGFAREKMHWGRFEMGLNNWAYVDK